MRQKNCWSYFAFSQIRLVEGKIVPAELLPHEAEETQPLGISRIQQGSVYLASDGKALLELFCH